MLNIICFLWGDWPAPGLGPMYVERLFRGVARNLNQPFRFTCFTDKKFATNAYIRLASLKALSWKGCLPKLYAYNPNNGLEGRVLIFDLDNVITGDLTPMADYRGDLAVRAWFKGYDRGERVPDGDMIGFEAGAPTARALWEQFSKNVAEAEDTTGGRERYFLRANATPDLWQDVLGPQSILSYKNHLRGGQPLPSETRIVSFHDGGKPGGTMRQHQVDAPWLKEHWS